MELRILLLQARYADDKAREVGLLFAPQLEGIAPGKNFSLLRCVDQQLRVHKNAADTLGSRQTVGIRQQ